MQLEFDETVETSFDRIIAIRLRSIMAGEASKYEIENLAMAAKCRILYLKSLTRDTQKAYDLYQEYRQESMKFITHCQVNGLQEQ
jgi:hypothetical protein